MRLPSVISTDENCVLHYSGRDTAVYFVTQWKSLQRLINNHGPSLEKIGPIRRFQIANCAPEMRSKTGPKPTDLALLPGHVRLLRGLVRKRLENSHLIRDMAEHEAKLERRFQLDHKKALKQTHQHQQRLVQYPELTDLVRDRLRPLIKGQNPTSTYLRETGPHNIYSALAKELKQRDTPREIAISNLMASDFCHVIRVGCDIDAPYKEIVEVCKEMKVALLDRLSSPPRPRPLRQLLPLIGTAAGVRLAA